MIAAGAKTRSGLRRGDIAFVAIAVAFFALFMAKGALLGPPHVSAAEFDAARAFERLARILGDERPHPVDSAANDLVRERLLTEIRALGYKPETRDDFSCRTSQRWSAVSCARVRNIAFQAGPSAGEAIMIASHYDSVGAGPGAADDGAGLAVSLEVAALLKKRRPVKHVIFLITDGEEEGLIGAASFVDEDPLAKKISAVINLEARGVTGPAMLFETSIPNGRDVAAFSRRVRNPFGNSLAAEIYRMMPNDTDMSAFLTLGPDAINLAFADRAALYHTPLDNLANLDRRSLAHIGATALSTLDGFLNHEHKRWNAAENRFAYSDIFGRLFVVIPEYAALALLSAGLAAAATLFFASKSASPLIAAAAPLIAMTAGGAIAFGTVSLVGAVRAEGIYWGAHPEWTRAMIYLSAILGGAIASSIAGSADRVRLLCAGWFWFSALGLAAYLAAPGSALATGVPAGLFACAALASFGARRLLAPFSLIALAAAFVLWAPMLHFAEVGLGMEGAWPIAVVAALIFMLAAPALGSGDRFSKAVMLGLSGALAIAVGFALYAPAYSDRTPRGLNIAHIVGAGKSESYWSLGASPETAPKEMAAIAGFQRARIKGLQGERVAAIAPRHDGEPVGVEIISSTLKDGGRELLLRLRSNGADQIVLEAPKEAGLAAVSIAGLSSSFEGDERRTITCTGRSCETFEATVSVRNEPSQWTVYGVRYGLGPESEALRAARPSWATPVHGGDTRIVLTRMRI
jgi:hypothetical protein